MTTKRLVLFISIWRFYKITIYKSLCTFQLVYYLNNVIRIVEQHRRLNMFVKSFISQLGVCHLNFLQNSITGPEWCIKWRDWQTYFPKKKSGSYVNTMSRIRNRYSIPTVKIKKAVLKRYTISWHISYLNQQESSEISFNKRLTKRMLCTMYVNENNVS